MRELIKNPVCMTRDEIEDKFAGKWILITNCEEGSDKQTIRGIPVAVADTIFEGYQDGFYDKFKAIEYKPTLALDLNYNNLPGLMGI